jgi:PKD repeat protein/photosystem II stability/assembly factor-like uncharacterized protein
MISNSGLQKLLVICLLIVTQIYFAKSQAVSTQKDGDTANTPYWIGMMQDETVSIPKVQRAFETYWNNKPITKSCGWKPFKRWEYNATRRMKPNGDRQPADRNLKAYKQFLINNPAKENFGNWTEMGPHTTPTGSNGLGRINAIGFHPTDPLTVYAGAPAGGLWKTTDGGMTWSSNTDNLPTLGVSSIVVSHSDPNIIFIGTGDRDAGDAPGLGVMKTNDGGLTWNLANTGMGNKTVGKLLMNPLNDHILIAASNGGIFKTTDACQNWQLVSPNSGDFKDLVFKPGNPEIVYAASGGTFYKSVNGGNSWAVSGTGLPGGSRGVIGVTPANPEIVYFLLGNSDSYKATYKSIDGGNTFVLQSDSPNILSWGCSGGSGGQAWYDLAIAVDPVNPDVILAGGVNIFRSLNGGVDWEISAHWWGDCQVANVHADLHVLEICPINNRLYAGNDGGVYFTDNQGDDWTMISQGLTIGQVYKIGQSTTDRELVMNGYQDNGTSCHRSTGWTNVMGGDGMECAIDPTNSLYKYGTVYYGSIDRIYNFNNQGNIASNGSHGITEEGAWITPFIIHEANPNTMFIGYKNVWRSNNIRALSTNAVTWTKISGFNGSNCSVLEQSPVNPDILYVVKENHRMFRTDQANSASPVWVELTTFLPSASTPSDLECHPTLQNIVYMTSDNQVYKSIDRGVSWTNITMGLPDVLYTTIVYCKGSQEGLYVGSDLGVFYKDASMTSWLNFSNGLPLTGNINELEIYYDVNNPENNRIRAATYGRGLWESPLNQSMPVASFVADKTTVPAGCAINFTDLSLGYPTSWNWTFTGGTPSSSNAQNPQNITFASSGVYDVILIVTNSIGGDTLHIPAYINISNAVLPLPGFTVNDSIFCSGDALVTFFDTSTYCPTTWLWSFVPPNVTFMNNTTATSQNPVVKFNSDGLYTVNLTVGNVNGSVNYSVPSFIIVGGLPLPFTDDFESGKFSSKAWTIENPNNDKTWDIVNTGGNPPGNKSARVLIYGTNSMGKRDRLISPSLDLTGLIHPGVRFMHAYAQYQTDYTDSLIVYVSDDCGMSWDRVFAAGDDGLGSFATHPPMTSSFVPMIQNDWCGGNFGSDCHFVDLEQYADKKNVKIAFETCSSMSNNIYLDNVVIGEYTDIEENNFPLSGILVYPNPTKGLFSIKNLNKNKITLISIYTPQGQLITNINPEKNKGDFIEIIDITSQKPGIYYLRITTTDGFWSTKLVLQ